MLESDYNRIEINQNWIYQYKYTWLESDYNRIEIWQVNNISRFIITVRIRL